jgi:hypothetical protein
MKETTALMCVPSLGEATGSLAKTFLSQLNPLEFVREYSRLSVVAEEQQTERERIKARRDVAVLAIDSERQILADYFDRRFAERRAVLDEMFGVLSQAVESKNDEVIDSALRGIVQVVGDNPLRDLDAFRRSRRERAMLEF